MLSLEGRIVNVSLAQLKNSKIKNYKCIQFNLENDFSEFGKFDLIINFGLIYHLKNVEKHLNCCAQMSDEILLEGGVCDSTDPSKIILVNDPEGNDESLNGLGSRPGPYFIERIFENNNFEVIRCFSKDLNSEYYVYDWEHKNDNSVFTDKRRFWNFKRRR